MARAMGMGVMVILTYWILLDVMLMQIFSRHIRLIALFSPTLFPAISPTHFAARWAGGPPPERCSSLHPIPTFPKSVASIFSPLAIAPNDNDERRS